MGEQRESGLDTDSLAQGNQWGNRERVACILAAWHRAKQTRGAQGGNGLATDSLAQVRGGLTWCGRASRSCGAASTCTPTALCHYVTMSLNSGQGGSDLVRKSQ